MICPSCRAQNKPGSKFCIQCGSALTVQPLSAINQQVKPAPTPARHQPTGNWLMRNKKYLWGLLVLVLLFGIPYYQKYQNDRSILARYDALYTTKKHAFLVPKIKDSDIETVDTERFRLKLRRSQQKAAKLQDQTEQKYRLLTTVNNLYSHKKIVGNVVKAKVAISPYTTTTQVGSAQKITAKLPNDQFKKTVNNLLADTKADIKLLGSINNQISDLITQENYDNGTIDSKIKKIKSAIKKVKNEVNREEVTKNLKYEIDRRDEAEEEFADYSRQSSIQSLSDVTDLDDLEGYNSDLTPQRIALYVYSEEYTWDGKRTTRTNNTEDDYVDGEIADSDNDDIKAYWKLEDDGTLTFYDDSDLTEVKKGPFDAFDDYNESDMLDYIHNLS